MNSSTKNDLKSLFSTTYLFSKYLSIILLHFLSITHSLNHQKVPKFIKADLLKISGARLQPPWLGKMDQIARTKRLTNYSNLSLVPKLLGLFGTSSLMLSVRN